MQQPSLKKGDRERPFLPRIKNSHQSLLRDPHVASRSFPGHVMKVSVTSLGPDHQLSMCYLFTDLLELDPGGLASD